MTAGSPALTADFSPLGVNLLDSLGNTSLPEVMPGMLLGAVMEWLPTFVTPIWVISMGLVLGAVALLAFYGVLAVLSFIPGLGNLGDNPRNASIASLVIGIAGGLFLCFLYVPTVDEHSGMLYLPLILLGIVMGYGIVYGMWHRTRVEWYGILTEGVVPYLLSVIGVFALIGLSGTLLVENPNEILDSVKAVNLVGDGTVSQTVTVPGFEGDDVNESPFVPVNISYNLATAQEINIQTDASVYLADSANATDFRQSPTLMQARQNQSYSYENRERPPLPRDPSELHIQNREVGPATVVFTFTNTPRIPQASSVVVAAVAFFLLITAIMAFRQAAPRVWALSLSTAKNEMAQPLFLLLIAVGVIAMVVFAFMPFNTLGDDIRVLKDCGVTTIMLLGMIQVVWSAGTSVSDEIEGRTALTVLSKPVSRRSFVMGKYAGIMLSVLVLFFIVSVTLLLLMSYKPIFEARENSAADAIWQLGHGQIMSTVPVIGLYFMETMVIGAIAVALATRLPLLANFVICFTVYVIGHLTSILVASNQGKNALVGFVGNLIAVIVPNLNVFNVQAAIDSGGSIPPIYLAATFNYLFCFVIAIWMVAMLLFEDRDLA